MPRYRVTYIASASSWVDVDAEDEADALAKSSDAFDEVEPMLCHNCSDRLELDPWEPDRGTDENGALLGVREVEDYEVED